MKTIEIKKTGEIRKAYEFSDLDEDIQTKVLENQVNFEVEIMDEQSPYYYLVEKMKRMQTPWFLQSEIYHNHKADLIESININGYLFDEDGDMLNITYHVKGNKIYKTTFGRKEYECEIH